MDYENYKCLDDEGMDKISSIFVRCVNEELGRIPNVESRTRMYTVLLKIFFDVKLHTLIHPRGLMELSESVFMDSEFRDFLHELTARFNICVVGYIHSKEASLEKTVALGLATESLDSKSEDDIILTPLKFLSSVENDPIVIYKILKNNRWILTIAMIAMYCDKTSIPDLQLVKEQN